MKKMNRAVSVVLIILTAIVGFTCKPGLGSQIDVLPPSGEITYPNAGETPIRGSFILRGTAKDDDGIQSIAVVFENIETKERTRSYQAILTKPGADGTEWTANIANESVGTVPGHELVKEYPIPDGEYTAIVSVTDKGGKISTFTKNYKIDNTPPVFIVQRPSAIIINDDSTAQADSYGSVFTVIGQAEDRSKIEDLTLKVDGTNISVSKKFVGKNINEEIATATKNASDFTDPLYKYNADHASPKIKAHISLTDNARFFKGDGNEGEGNTSEWYYLRDRDIRSVLEKGYTADVINDYFAGKKGSASSPDKTQQLLAKLYDDNDTEGQSVKQILKDARIMTNGSSGVQKFSLFTLDPNKSPGFKVTNGTNFPQSFPATTPDANLPHPGVEFFSGSVRPKVSLKLIPNKNNDALVKTSDYNGYRASGIVINMYKCTAVSYVTSGDKKILNLAQSAVPSYSLKFADLSTQDEIDQVVTGTSELTVQWQLPNPATFSAGYYVIEVEGKDTENNDFVAYDRNNSPGGSFVIKFEAAGTHLMILPGAPSGFVKEAFHVIANVSSGQPVTKVCYKLDGAAGESDTGLPHSSGTEWKTAAPVSGTLFDSLSEGEHKVHFWAKNNAGQTATANIAFIKDTTAPIADLKYPPANAEQAGTQRIMGDVTDAHAGVNKDGTKYIIGKQASVPTPATTGWRVMDKTTPVSWEFTYNLDDFSSNPASHGDPVTGKPDVYDIPVYILTEDNIGNKAVKPFTVRYDSAGDKPVVTVLSPQQNQTLGGTVQIFGTAAARLGTPADIGDVYIQFSKNGDFNDTANGNMTFGASGGGYDADWHKGGNGQLVPDDDNTPGGSYWQILINENGAFNNPNGSNWAVYFRVRAKNKTTHKYGPWSEPVKIFIDENYPTIGSPDPLTLVNKSDGSNPINYTPGMWITDGKKLIGSLYDDSGIKTVEISSQELLGNQKYNLSQALSNHWIVEDTAHAPASPGAKNYTLQIPLDLSTLSEAVKRKGEISIKIKIVDMGQNLLREETVKLNFDITLPAGDLGDFIYRHSGNVRVSSIMDSNLAQKVKEYAPGPTPDYSKLRLLINDKIRTVTGVSGNTVSFAPNLDRAGTYNCLLYKAPYIIRNDGGNWIVRGVAHDDGSGIKKIEATVTVDGQTAQSGEITGNKITQHLGGQVSWEGEINLSTLKDGKGKLSCKIYDEQGNVYPVPDVDVVVKNKPIVVSKVTLKTKIGTLEVETDKAGAPETDPKTTVTKKTNDKLDQTVTVESSNFAFKSKTDSKIKVAFTGGQGTVKYRLKKGDGTTIGVNLRDVPNDKEIVLTAADLTEIANSNGTPTKITLEFWDEALGFTQGTDSSCATVDITTLFDALDAEAPKVVILPFHWNGENDNSLYENKRANGHVEIAKINSLGNDHSSVSGKVTIRGFAYDNVKIDSIKAVVPFSSDLTVTASGSNDTWTSGQTMTANGVELKVTRLDVDYSGFYAKWELSFDSSKIAMGAAKDIKVIANDGGRDSVESAADIPSASLMSAAVSRDSGNSATVSDSSFDSAKVGQFVVFRTGEKQYFTRIVRKNKNGSKTTITLADSVPTDMKQAAVYKDTANKTKVSVNSVPYITGIKTALTGSAGVDFDRSALGFYPVYAGEKITLKGFNIKSSPSVKLGTKDLTSKVSAYNQAAGTFAVEIEDTADVKTGELTITVGTTQAINNDNKNPVIGTDGTVTEAAYNSWQNRANKRLADDLKLSVWKVDAFHSSIQKDITSPMLKIAPDSKWYMSYGNGIPHMAVNKNGNQTHVDKSFNKFHNTAVAFDSTGNIYAVGTNTDRIDNSSAKFSFYSRAVPKSSSNSDYTEAWTGKSRLEKVFNQGIYNINRVPHPKLVVTGNTTLTKVYISYFDANHPKNPVKFRFGTVGSSNNFTDGIADGGGTNTSAGAMDSLSNGSAPGYHTIADDDSPRYKGGPYVAHGVTSGGVAVVAWYDATNKCLVYSYNTTPQTPAQGGVWQTNAQLIDDDFAGWYVDLAVDKNNGIHIAYYSSSKGDLKYAYLPSYNGTATVVTVDSYLSVGTQISISTREESGKIVPYISYFQSAFTQTPSSVRVAWRNDLTGTVKDGAKDELFTGNWEVMTIPMKGIIPKDETICNGVPTGGGWANTVVLGFMSDDGYKKAVLKK